MILVGMLVALVVSASATDDSSPWDIVSPGANQDAFDLLAGIFPGSEVSPTPSDSDEAPTHEWRRAPMCVDRLQMRNISLDCVGGEVVELCDDGSEALEPWWVRPLDGSGQWTAATGYVCPEDAARRAQILTEWASMRPTPPAVNVQPQGGWVLATVPTIVYVEPAPVVEQVTLLGVPVRIRANPSSYEWDWGDGESTTTSDPGAAYPNETVTYTYGFGIEAATIEMTTTWSGEYSVDGGPWIAIDGTVTSTAPGVDLEIVTTRSRLVECDLNGDC